MGTFYLLEIRLDHTCTQALLCVGHLMLNCMVNDKSVISFTAKCSFSMDKIKKNKVRHENKITVAKFMGDIIKGAFDQAQDFAQAFEFHK